MNAARTRAAQADRTPIAPLRTAGWTLLFLLASAFAVFCAAEAYLRLTLPFAMNHSPLVFVPSVGTLFAPGSEVRTTNGRDYWTVQKANSLGFLDREHPAPRAAESCHAVVIGGSLVEAAAVPITDKFHVRFEELAARALPDLDVTASAYGFRGAAQIAQLPFYDAYAQRLEPELAVLVFEPGHFASNAPLRRALSRGLDPDLQPRVTAVQAEDGTMTLRPPGIDSPDERAALMEPLPPPPSPWPRRVAELLAPHSYAAAHAAVRTPRDRPYHWSKERRAAWMERVRRRPDYAWILPGGSAGATTWLLPSAERRNAGGPVFLRRHPPRVQEYLLDFTAFGLDRFKERADRDGAALVILAAWQVKAARRGMFDLLRAMAGERGIPLIDHYDYIFRAGGDVREARFDRDGSWSAAGHRWAAEALLEWIADNRRVCDDRRKPPP